MKNNEILIERREQDGFGQRIVTAHKKKEWAFVLDFLNEKGYRGVGEISKSKLPKPPALVVDKAQKVYFLTSVSCLAAATVCGDRAISAEEFIKLSDREQNA